MGKNSDMVGKIPLWKWEKGRNNSNMVGKILTWLENSDMVGKKDGGVHAGKINQTMRT